MMEKFKYEGYSFWTSELKKLSPKECKKMLEKMEEASKELDNEYEESNGKFTNETRI